MKWIIKILIWFIISCIFSLIGGMIGAYISREIYYLDEGMIGWGALIGFFFPTFVILSTRRAKTQGFM
ncbi:MAG: hypothetical protein ACTSPU_12200 [Promethearchaeota archaeon]